MIMILKIKESKETWNQASGVQVRGGLLGYKDQSTAICQSTANVNILIKVKVLLHNEDHSEYFEENKDLQGLKWNIV
jgi:hypothetical protein